MMSKIRILTVCNWPVGGIRTYLKYNYRYFSGDKFEITVLTSPSIELDSLEKDMAVLGIRVLRAPGFMGANSLAFYAFRELFKGDYDLIHSQGFISAFHAAAANLIFRITHVMTIHGVFEKKYFEGKSGRIKRFLFSLAMKNVDIFHGVSHGISDHLKRAFPKLGKADSEWVIIKHGIAASLFLADSPRAGAKLRSAHEIEAGDFIFGYFGRFMPEKGFAYIIEAADIINSRGKTGFMVMAVGTGDYEREYKKEIRKRGLEKRFRFMPFSPEPAEIMKGCDTILMPSKWEAWGLVACESLCAGIPLIASDCVGLREATEDTPAIRIPSGDSSALADAMIAAMADSELKTAFDGFKNQAAERFDVEKSALRLADLFEKLTSGA